VPEYGLKFFTASVVSHPAWRLVPAFFHSTVLPTLFFFFFCDFIKIGRRLPDAMCLVLLVFGSPGIGHQNVFNCVPL